MPGPDFESVVAGYYEPLYRFAISLTHSEADACDLAQQTFYMWAKKGHQLRDASKVKSWLFTTLYRAFLESRRHFARFPHSELTEAEADLPVILPEAARQLDAMQAVAALGQVDEVYRAPVALFYLEDFSYLEIADILEVPLGTVKSRLARGLGQLRNIFAAATRPATNPEARVNKQEAKQILALFRPGTADEKDAFFDEARQLAKTDLELGRWLDEHCKTYLALRRKFQTIPIPPGLKEQIISERKIQRPFFERHAVPLLAAAAAVALLVGVLSGLWPFHGRSDRYAAYRKRMTETALRNYSMDLLETNTGRIRNYLQEKKAPADYALPAGLRTASAVGCVVSHWQGSPVSMISFNPGCSLPPGAQSDLWFFVIDSTNVATAPSPGEPVFERVNKATTASWSDEHKTYFLAAVGDEAFLRKYLP